MNDPQAEEAAFHELQAMQRPAIADRCEETRERAVRGEPEPIIERCKLDAGHDGQDHVYATTAAAAALVGANPLEWHPAPEEEPEVDTSAWLWCAVAVCGCVDVTYEGPQDAEVARSLAARGYRLEKRPPEDARIDACPHRLS